MATGKQRVCEFFECNDPKELWRSDVGNSGLFSLQGSLTLCAYWSEAPTNLDNISDDGLRYILKHPALEEYKTWQEWKEATKIDYNYFAEHAA